MTNLQYNFLDDIDNGIFTSFVHYVTIVNDEGIESIQKYPLLEEHGLYSILDSLESKRFITKTEVCEYIQSERNKDPYIQFRIKQHPQKTSGGPE